MNLITVSNRLPIKLEKEDEDYKIYPGSGGLVTAIEPILKKKHGHWIGWPGITEELELDELLEKFSAESGYKLHPVFLSEEELNLFYYGFSNEVIWPLFHNLQTRCNFVPEYWRTYLNVNRKYAMKIAEVSSEDDYIWIQDYHLMNVGQMIKVLGHSRKTGFFLHIPFPVYDTFSVLPWRAAILDGLLNYDLIGFQTARDRRNFIGNVRAFKPEAKISGRGSIINIKYHDREVKVGSFPISIDFEDFSNRAKNLDLEKCTWNFRKLDSDCKIMIGLDRLDYTKGILERLHAFRNALRRYPDLIKKLTLVQLIIPSREQVPEYQELKAEVERLIGEINGEFTKPDWVPIKYIYDTLDKENLVAFYRTADIALVTPLRDGMNLVAKEYCTCNIDNDGVLILSEFAGAAPQLRKNAIMVNPYDIEGVADAIYRAYNINEKEAARRMKKLRAKVKNNDIYRWVRSSLDSDIL